MSMNYNVLIVGIPRKAEVTNTDMSHRMRIVSNSRTVKRSHQEVTMMITMRAVNLLPRQTVPSATTASYRK